MELISQGGRVDQTETDFGYLPGFENTHSTEAMEGALPIGRSNPQKPPLGLYAEEMSGTAFTAPRMTNHRSWTYRIRPSVKHGAGFEWYEHGYARTAPCRNESTLPPMQLRWHPLETPEVPTDFVDGLRTMTTCGDAWTQSGMAAHVFVANQSMTDRYFMNADGEMLILPQDGSLRFVTEFGLLCVEAGEIAVIPRGVKCQVELMNETARGYICENYGAIFTLPERGPIGSNHLANERDFLYPVAAYEDREGSFELHMKWQGKFCKTTLSHSPLDVVAWHGSYAPYKYDLKRFAVIGSLSYDHPDPSILTVLTSASGKPGVANVDFVIFPDRWLVMEDTFRPPWYHMNTMSEFMGLLYGVYDAKPGPGGFVPGGMSLHNAFLPHGPNAEAFSRGTSKKLEPEKLTNTMAFMFESRYVQTPTAFASDEARIDMDYAACWDSLESHFKPDR